MVNLGTLEVVVGTVGLAAFDFGRDVSALQMTATVYSVSPTNGQGGTPLFSYQMQPLATTPDGETDPAAWWQAIPLQAKDTAAPTKAPHLYGRIEVVYPGQPNDYPQLFTFKVAGK